MDENLIKRIGDEYLQADHKDGETFLHTDYNEFLSIFKTSINENYYDIQRITNGTLKVYNTAKLDGATLSRSVNGSLSSDDNTIPSSKQVKTYVDNYYNELSKKDESLSTTVSGAVNAANTAIDTANNALSDASEALDSVAELSTTKADVSSLPTKISQLTNDSGYIDKSVENLDNYYRKNEIDVRINQIKIGEDNFNDNLESQFFNDNSIYYENKVVDRIEDLEEIAGKQLKYKNIDFMFGRWVYGKRINISYTQWMSCNPIDLKAGDKFILPFDKYVAQLIKFRPSLGYEVENVSYDIRNNVVAIENDGVYALSLYIDDGKPEITNADLEYAKQNINVSAFSNTVDVLRNTVDVLKDKLLYNSHYDDVEIGKGRWTTNPTPDVATIWCASERMYLKIGDKVEYNKYLYQTQLIEFGDDSSAPSKVNETSNEGFYNIEKDGYYALNIFKNTTLDHSTSVDWTEEEIDELKRNLTIISITLDEIEELKDREDNKDKKQIIINVDYLKGKVTTGNQNYFHTSNFSSEYEITINYLNTDSQLDDLYGDIYVINQNDEVINVIDGMVLPAGTYYLEGYRLPIQIVSDEVLAKISTDFQLSTYERISIYSVPSNKESLQARLVPFAENDEQKTKENYIEEFKYPTVPIWGHEYLQHWYEKVYEANQSATIVLDGDSITEGYAPEYSGVNDAFRDMRGYAIKKIMKAGNYPLDQLTVVNNGHGGRKTGEWVGNPIYGAPNYVEQYPNGFLDDAMSNNPDLLIIAWGMNDADKTNSELSGLSLEERLEVFKNNMIEGLERIRGSEPINGRPAYNKPLTDLSIIICLPIVGGSESTGRGNYLWNQYIREIIRPLCRKYGCAFADMTMRTYAHNDMGNRIWSTLTASGGYGGIHPNIWSSAQTMSMLQDLIYPVCLWNISLES